MYDMSCIYPYHPISSDLPDYHYPWQNEQSVIFSPMFTGNATSVPASLDFNVHKLFTLFTCDWATTTCSMHQYTLRMRAVRRLLHVCSMFLVCSTPSIEIACNYCSTPTLVLIPSQKTSGFRTCALTSSLADFNNLFGAALRFVFTVSTSFKGHRMV